MKYAVFIPWLAVALAGALLLLAAEGIIKLIGFIQEKINATKVLHSGKRFFVY